MDEIKKNIVKYCVKMLKDSLTTGTGGNISVKNRENIFITPSGIDYLELDFKDISVLDLNGNYLGNGKKPSSETAFHCAVYKKRPDVQAIVHTHSVYSTVLACMKKELPPIHYLVALSGDKVPVAEYGEFGSVELSDNIISVLENYNAVFLANHGLVTMGESLLQAYNTALHIEFCSKIYVLSLGIGTPNIIESKELNKIKNKIKNYTGN